MSSISIYSSFVGLLTFDSVLALLLCAPRTLIEMRGEGGGSK